MSQAASKVREVLPLLVVAALTRVAFLMIVYARTGTRILTQGDTESYLEPGRNLFQHFSFAASQYPSFVPEIDRTPGYPIFAMLTGMLNGHVVGTVLAQIVVSIGSLLLVRRIARYTFPDPNAAAIAGWLYAFEPLSFAYTLRVMPETLFIFLLLVVIERLLCYLRSGRLTVLVVCALSLGAATYVRPVSYYLVLPIMLALAFVSWQRSRNWWQAPALFVAILFLLLFSWQLRNRIETGYGGFSSIVEKNLYFFQSAEITAEIRHISLDAQHKELGYGDDSSYVKAHPEQAAWSHADRLRFMHQQSTAILSAHAGLYLKSHFKGVAIVAFTPSVTETLQMVNAYVVEDATPRHLLNDGIVFSIRRTFVSEPVTAVAMVLMEAILLSLYVFAMRGCFIRHADRLAIVVLIGFALYFLLISGGAQAVGRYRLPIMPEICILAAGGLANLTHKKKSEAA